MLKVSTLVVAIIVVSIVVIKLECNTYIFRIKINIKSFLGYKTFLKIKGYSIKKKKKKKSILSILGFYYFF